MNIFSFLLLCLISLTVIRPTEAYSIDESNAIDFFEGIVAGFAGSAIPCLESCAEDIENILGTVTGDLDSAFSQIDAGFHSLSGSTVSAGLGQLGDAINSIQQLVKNCKNAESEIEILVSTVTNFFVDPVDALTLSAESCITHGYDIYKDVKGAIDAWDSSDRDYETVGSKIGSLLGIMCEKPKHHFWEELFTCAIIPDTNGDIQTPHDITSIPPSGFKDCTGLHSFVFGENSHVTSIGASAFEGTTLKSIKFPGSLQVIGNSAFQQSNLQEVMFHSNSNLKSIGVSAFADSSDLTTVNIPANVESIGAFAFSNDLALQDFTFDCDCKVAIDNDAFSPSFTCGLNGHGGLKIPTTVLYGGDITTTKYSDPSVCNTSNGDSPAPNTQLSNNKPHDKISTNAIIGICVGCLVVLLLAGVYYRRTAANKEVTNGARGSLWLKNQDIPHDDVTTNPINLDATDDL